MSDNQVENPREARPERRFRGQVLTSLVLFTIGLVVAVSGVILFLSPRGRVANWGGWQMLGLDRETWVALHINATLVFLVFVILHLYFNWRLFLGYLKRGLLGIFALRLELLLAILAAVGVVLGTLYDVTPFSQVVALRERMKNYWEERTPAVSIPHLEEFTVARLAEVANVPVDDVLAAMKELGVTEPSAELVLADAARQVNLTPQKLFEALREKIPQLAQLEGGPRRGRMGMGVGMGQGRGQEGGTATESEHGRGGGGGGPGRGPGYGRGGGFGRGQGGGGPGYYRRMMENQE